jgi:hypothetical protein
LIAVGPRYKEAVQRAVSLVLLALVLAGCGSEGARERVSQTASKTCPAAWRAGWQALADDIRTAVYCPMWMPNPLDAKIGGTYANGRSVSLDRSYLVSFVWVEPGSGEVHVNFRGYPGNTRIPTCSDLDTGKPVPCFSDPGGRVRIGGITARLYRANQGADQWHLLYAWRQAGSLYSLSEHVAPPYTYGQVLRNLKRILGGFVLVRPET